MATALRRYQLRERIGAGGMAEAWLADAFYAEGVKRQVVVKRMHSHLSTDPAYRAMFMEEARIAASLSHPNIVQLLDLGSMDERLFLTLEYVDGADLSAFLRAEEAAWRMVPLPTALWVTCQVLRGLEYLHTRTGRDGKPLQLVHRDVGLGNVLLSRQGEVKLSDFGIAKSATRQSRTAVGVIKGNLLSMAPEQISGGQVSNRTDLYAAGLLLHALLIGRHPLESVPRPLLFEMHMEGRLPLPSATRPAIDPQLDSIVARATAVAPATRFASAADFETVLNEFAARHQIRMGPTELMAELAALAEVAGLEAEEPTITSSGGFTRPAAAKEAEARTVVAVAEQQDPITGTVLRTTQDALTPLTSQVPSSFRDRVNTLAYKIEPPGESEAGTDTQPSPFVIPPDLLTTDGEVSSPAPAEPISSTSPGSMPAVTPPGTVTVEWGGIAASRPEPVFLGAMTGHRQSVNALVAAPGLLASASSDGTVIVWDLMEKKPAQVFRGHVGPCIALAASRDGARLLSGSRDGTVRLWKRGRPDALRVLKGHGRWASCVAFLPDGQRGASGGDDRTVRIWNLESGVLERTIDAAHNDFVSVVAGIQVPPALVSGSYDGTLTLWDGPSGSEVRTMGGAESIRALDIAPSGKVALTGSADGKLRLWDLASGRNLATLPGHEESVGAVRFLNDGMAVSGGFDGQIGIWNLAGQRKVGSIHGKAGMPILALAVLKGRVFASSGSSVLAWKLDLA